MRRIITIFLSIFSVSSSTIYAQKFFNNNFYLMNPYSYNLAHAGQSKELVTTAQFAGQNTGLSSTPQTSSLFIRKGFLREAGLGLRFIMDQRGVFRTTRIAFESSYRIVINPGAKHHVSFGLGGGANWENIDIEQIEESGLSDMNDPMLFTGNARRSDIQFGAAIAYQIQGFEVGLSMPFILGLYGGERDGSSFWKYFAASLGYELTLGENINLHPLLMLQRPASGPQLLDIVCLGEWQKKYKLQLGYRSNGSLLTGLGLQLGPIHMGYTTELPLGTYAQLAGAAHSIMIGFTVNEKFFSSSGKRKRKSNGLSPGRKLR